MLVRQALAITVIVNLACGGTRPPTTQPNGETAAEPVEIPEESKICVDCHLREKVGVAGIIAEWRRSTHAISGIGCTDCHTAKPGDADAMKHYDTTIAVIPSPADCAECHEDESTEFQASEHGTAGAIEGTLDYALGATVEGPRAVVSGCVQCHGSKVKILAGGKPDPATWPNSGIGRLNPDGSKGSCTACHPRHSFDAAAARRPEVCGKCHLGPDHPQKEIYEESKHGIAFRSNQAAMALDDEVWVLGKDYTAAPTCATCHMSATGDLEITHDPGKRLSWNLRAQTSTKQEGWEEKRAVMQSVCGNCHGKEMVVAFYQQLDAAVAMYNQRFAAPSAAVMAKLRAAGKLTETPFDEPIEWELFKLWRQGGRSARQGAAMLGPDYVQWHGFFVIADQFYNQILPRAEALLPGVSDEVTRGDAHRWWKAHRTSAPLPALPPTSSPAGEAP